MRNSDKLSALGVKDDDLLMMMVSNASSGYDLFLLLYFDSFGFELLIMVCLYLLCSVVVRQGVIWGWILMGQLWILQPFNSTFGVMLILWDSYFRCEVMVTRPFSWKLELWYYSWSSVLWLWFDVVNCRQILSLRKWLLGAIWISYRMFCAQGISSDL